jgi:hypothetical protein
MVPNEYIFLMPLLSLHLQTDFACPEEQICFTFMKTSGGDGTKMCYPRTSFFAEENWKKSMAFFFFAREFQIGTCG